MLRHCQVSSTDFNWCKPVIAPTVMSHDKALMAWTFRLSPQNQLNCNFKIMLPRHKHQVKGHAILRQFARYCGRHTERQWQTNRFCIQVRPIAEDEMFKVMRSGKRQKKQWKRMVTKPTFVGAGFTRKPPKYERFIRPSGRLTHMFLTAMLKGLVSRNMVYHFR